MTEGKRSLWDTESEWLDALEQVTEAKTPEEECTALAVYDDSLHGAIEKRERVAGFIRHVEARAEFLKREEARIAVQRRTLENGVVRLKAYIVDVMLKLGLKKIMGTTSWFTLVENSIPRLAEDNADLTPDEFWYVPEPQRAIDMAAIREALNAGKEVPGWHLEHGHHVRMK